MIDAEIFANANTLAGCHGVVTDGEPPNKVEISAWWTFDEDDLLKFAREIRRAAFEEAAKACMRATPNAQTRKAIGDAAHYLACAVAIRALADGEKNG